MKKLIRQCLVQIRCQLVEEKPINQEAIFIDGTKIEAYANKYTFFWEKSVEKHHNNLVKTATIYRHRKIDVEPIFGLLKANLCFRRFSVRGKSKVTNEIGLALMVTILREYAVRG